LACCFATFEKGNQRAGGACFLWLAVGGLVGRRAGGLGRASWAFELGYGLVRERRTVPQLGKRGFAGRRRLVGNGLLGGRFARRRLCGWLLAATLTADQAS